MSFPRTPVDLVEYGFQVPARERWSEGEAIATETLEDAEAFVRSHPGCVVVQRRVVVSPWEPVDPQ